MSGRTTTAALALTLAFTAGACTSDADVTASTGDADAAPANTDGSAGEQAADDPGSIEAVDGGGGRSGAAPLFVPEPIVWDAYADGVDIGLLDVPVDYGDPDGAAFELFVARHRALDPDERIGSLVVNRGGPGFGGALFAIYAPQIFDEALLERFDIIGWDPRGVGESEPAIDCIDDFDRYFTIVDSTPETDEERELMVGLAASFAQECIDHNGGLIDHVGTNNSARDIDTLRRALGEDTISYFGFSYGGELGAAWATLFPDTVRAAVLDGTSDPNADALESSLQQMRGFESSLETFLAQCADDPDCAFHNDGDPRGAFLDLLAELDDDPVEVDSGRPPVNRDVAIVAVQQAMYSTSYWPALAASLASAAEGDGEGLLALYDAYYERGSDGTYSNELEAFQVISCADTSERPTVEEADADVALFVEAAPLLVPEDSIGSYFCTFFPPAADPRIDLSEAGIGAGPIVVIGTTGDPATPFESTVRMADALEDGRLVIVDADEHTGYGVNGCIVEVVNDYLIDLDAPPYGTECV